MRLGKWFGVMVMALASLAGADTFVHKTTKKELEGTLVGRATVDGAPVLLVKVEGKNQRLPADEWEVVKAPPKPPKAKAPTPAKEASKPEKPKAAPIKPKEIIWRLVTESGARLYLTTMDDPDFAEYMLMCVMVDNTKGSKPYLFAPQDWTLVDKDGKQHNGVDLLLPLFKKALEKGLLELSKADQAIADKSGICQVVPGAKESRFLALRGPLAVESLVRVFVDLMLRPVEMTRIEH